MFRDDTDDLWVYFTYEELKEYVEDFYNNLSEEAKYLKLKYNDLTYEEYVLYTSGIKPGQKIEINLSQYKYEIIDTND